MFKGGTSLSKCHKAISRFSEDVDLGVEADRLSQGEHKKVKAAVTGAMEAHGLAIPNIGETRSRRDYNKYVVELPYDVGAPGLNRDVTQTLLWERVPYDEAATSLSAIADFVDGIDWDA